MRIGELAQTCCVSRDTLRFYEERGLIRAQRRANGYRDYPTETVQLVLLIKTAQKLGFSLGEISQSVAELWQAQDPEALVTRFIEDKLTLVEARIDALVELRQALRQRLQDRCPLTLKGAPA
ncbi:MerR family transcriptional regulator [Pseudomonas japonica]|uniref:DNA-binding transcriptional regulator, MerR family n=1 Tax=Pseudomonas japonica TaxID=256466 RepID=A0A239J250_9PSED|nr:MerR family transcriptional regulator [Pseudomonas japonica]SNS99879.1 DNA-binding transcriptional regulator, MerR family [Pseudomonas japonica]